MADIYGEFEDTHKVSWGIDFNDDLQQNDLLLMHEYLQIREDISSNPERSISFIISRFTNPSIEK